MEPLGEMRKFALRPFKELVSKVIYSTPSMKSSNSVNADPYTLAGTPVSKGTRVPVKSLFEYLESNCILDECVIFR
jgi:hypothetical protein